MSEWKIGDKLVCLDVEAYLAIDNRWVLSRQEIVESSLIVDHIYKNGALGLEGTDYCIPVSDFQYFKKKEGYTFKDLIDVSTKAFKDGVLYQSNLVKGRLDYKADFNNDQTTVFDDDNYNFESHIKFIQSLYLEKFVIEREEDIESTRENAKVTLVNGNKGIVTTTYSGGVVRCIGLLFETTPVTLNLIALKGATVEQERTQ